MATNRTLHPMTAKAYGRVGRALASDQPHRALQRLLTHRDALTRLYAKAALRPSPNNDRCRITTKGA